jgi:hypothetical protein
MTQEASPGRLPRPRVPGPGPTGKIEQESPALKIEQESPGGHYGNLNPCPAWFLSPLPLSLSASVQAAAASVFDSELVTDSEATPGPAIVTPGPSGWS